MQIVQKGGVGMYQVVSYMYIRAKLALREFFTNESGEVNVVAIIVLIGVAVALALIFKEQITELIKTLVGKLTTKAGNAIDNA